MRSNNVWIAVLACALAPTMSFAQVFKWTDEQGQVHFSDHAPAGQANASVALSQVPKASKPVGPAPPKVPPGYTVDGRGFVVDQYGNSPEYNAQAEAIDKREREAGEARTRAYLESSQRAARDRAAAQAAYDKKLIAECKANHETYCTNNPEKLRQEINKRRSEEYVAALNQHDALLQQGISTPRPSPPAMETPGRTKVCQKGGKKCFWY